MSTLTKNYSMTKPSDDDFIDNDVLNANFDTIDEQMKANNNAAGMAQKAAEDAKKEAYGCGNALGYDKSTNEIQLKHGEKVISTLKADDFGGGTTIVQIPDVTVGSYTYNGKAQGPAIGDYDAGNIIISGATGTNAGDYTLTLSLADPTKMVWSDMKNADKAYKYTIAKAAGAVVVSASSVVLGKDATSATVTVSGNTGALSVSSSDSGVATASLSGSTLTIKSVNSTTGTAKITVTAAATTNYAAATATISVTAKFTTIYGAAWNKSSSTKWSRTDAAAGFTDPSPAIGTGSGSSPFDNCMPWSGIRKETVDGNVLVRIPKFYIKITNSSSQLKVQIADGPSDGFAAAPAFRDRGDGKGERDYIYVGRYTCNSSYKSTAGSSPKVNITRSSARSGIKAIGTGYAQYDILAYMTICWLYLVEFADWNTQAKIGSGLVNGSSAQTSGGTDNMEYHTGTAGGSRSANAAIQYRYIENMWGNVYQWVDGITFNGGTAYIQPNPDNFSDSASGTQLSVSKSQADGYISAVNVDTTYGIWMPASNSGSETTYVCDSAYYNSGLCLFCVGGGWNSGSDAGLFYFLANNDASASNNRIAARLIKLP